MKEVLKCEDIVFKYRETSKENIIDGFTYSFNKGEIYLITGFSGCGKSTLANVIAGLYPSSKGILSKGEVKLFGKEISEYPPEKRAEYIMMMFQNADTQFCMDIVRDEIIFCLENIAFPVKKIDEVVESVLKKIGIEYLKYRKISSLSGGEKQKLSLACILAVSPEIIILDEPFANVDYESSQEIVNILKNINREKEVTIIAVDHRISLWKDIDYTLLHLGKGCSFVDKNIDKYLVDIIDEEEYRNNFSKRYKDFEERKDAVAVENLDISYKKELILKDINLAIKEGGITSIIGKSGTGKTSLLKAIAGIYKISHGNIKIFGTDIKKIKDKVFINNVGIVFQNPQNQFIIYKVIDEIMFTMRNRYPKEDEKLLVEKSENLLKEFELYKYRNFSPFSLSQGQQRKLAVLSMLGAGQKIILCDEPTYGQDNKTSIEIMEFLKRKAIEENITVVMVSHDKNLVFRYSDFIYETTIDKNIRRIEV
ncbi:ABC transporter ATP-binding protein [Fusobacterium varium]|jgi:energy-coupling factor transporter ATP-binding protein EcfA2|uniref:ABC transporter ATP-binding protein n=1 Tax=Fusobacterium varium ATCC 27725 TaxID=469618 RepID=A0ABN5JG03_FUSVA|nr:ABC transporter ATP-binding protein [Fusobacterium varium]AVQ30747.1 ABC transporter ATP-binding protein [Fusobacterium varium ATCC 27725]EES64173.1 ABC transporter, ATP-binding protein [Fusobacterium varium ATCC 27725]VEH40633.1 Putative HMP/thiamine import ATP-binding protein YkoD [Fusobacterium varium]